MDKSTPISCPVCTLYLRPGITLQNHLASHPKQKVIEALCRVTELSSPENNLNEEQNVANQSVTSSSNMALMPPISSSVNSNITQISQVPMNQSFIYQQFMSSSGTQPIMSVNPMNQLNQHIIAVPTVFNQEMMCSPYIFQQQQQVQIMSAAAASIPPFLSPRPANIISSSPAICPSYSISEITEPERITTVTETPTTAQITSPSKSAEMKDPLQITQNIEEKSVPQMLSVSLLKSIKLSEKCDITTINEQIKSSNKVAAITSCASDMKNKEALININNDADDVPTSIPVELEEENNLRRDETLESNPSESNIIIETSDKEIITVTIKNSNSEYDVSNKDKTKELTEEMYENNTMEDDDDDDDDDMENNALSTKACQTLTVPIEKEEDYNIKSMSELIIVDNNNQEEIIPEDIEIVDVPSPKNHYDMSNEESTEMIVPTDDKVDNITVLEMSDFILPNDFIQNGQSIISKVNDIECINEANRSDRPQVLMSIGEETIKNAKILIEDKFSVQNFTSEKFDEESLNIRADERMPPRGELSEQESNGASEIGWGNRFHQEGSSGMSTSYDLLARESWEASDCSDSEVPPLQSRIPPTSSLDYKSDDVDDPDEVRSKSPSFNYMCPTCGEMFRCPKERRVHHTRKHGIPMSSTYTKKKIIRRRQIRQVRKDSQTRIKRVSQNVVKQEVKQEVSEASDVKVETTTVSEDIKENVLCNTCGELLPTKDWHAHNKKVHGIRVPNDNLICQKCGVSFPTQNKFTEHLRIHPLECNICGKNFYKIPNLKQHLRRHTGIRPHKCEVCTKAFFSKQKLMEHINVHTGNEPIKCTMCTKSFKRYSNLVQHRNRHHLNVKKKIKDYICQCGEIFHSKSKLQWHKETHELKPKGCKYCHEKFIHMASLTRHIRRIHNQRYVPDESRVNENVECPVCKGVYLKSSLDAHMAIHAGKKQHTCTICNKEFTTKWNLKLHKWTHASPNSKPYKCELCQAAYIRHNDYISHMNSHKSLRPYTCNYCGCKFIRKYNCLRHVREHEEGKSFVCDICNKSFHRSYYLKEHMRVHSGLRPFTCNICGKTSTTKSNHNKHMKIHHAREPVMTEG